MVDSTKSFEVSNDGISVEKADGTTGVWIGGGDAAPTHNAEIGSMYLRTNGNWYKQEGPGQNNWVIFNGEANSDELVKGSANDTTAGYLEDKIATTEGVQQTTLNDGGNEQVQVKLDINGLTQDSTPDINTDFLATYDASSGTHKKSLMTDILNQAVEESSYGNLFQENGTGFTIDIVTQDAWVKWTNSTAGPVSGPITLSTASDNITLGTGAAGTYEIEYSITLTATQNNQLIQGAFFLNGVVIGKTRASIQTETNDPQTLSYSCLMNLSDGDVLDFRLRNRTSAADINAFNACINISRMSGGARGPKGDPGSGSSIVLKDEGTVIGGSPHDTLNFVGDAFSITDNGSGEATILHTQYSHPNHTGEVTSSGDGATLVDKTAITNKITVPADGADFVLVSDTSDTGNLKKVAISDLLDDTTVDNTASNVGAGGVGVFKQKTGIDLEFKKINAGSNKVSITDDVANSEVDIDVNEGNINHDNLSGFVANEHIDWTADQGATNIDINNIQDASTTVKGVVELATDGEAVAGVAVQGNDSRLSDARTPLAHNHTLADVTDSGALAAKNTIATSDIDDNAVTYAKMQDVSATDRILGRDTVGAGDIEELTPAAVRTMINVADGANNYSHPNHTGDVTSSGDGATTISANAVDNTKSADMPANTLKGNNTGVTADPLDLTAAQVRTLINVADGATANDTDANLKNRANHTGTQTASTISDFDTEVANNSAVTANTAKVSNATHTGEVTGSAALTIDKTAITNKTSVVATSTDEVLISDSSDTGNLKRTTLQSIVDLAGGGSGGHTIQEEGTSLPQRTNLNFIGSTVTATDNVGTDSTDITIAAIPGEIAGAQGRRSTTFVPTSTPTAVSFDITDLENDVAVVSHDDTNTSRFYLQESGNHLAYVNLVCKNTVANADKTFRMQLYKNGTAIPASLVDIPMIKGSTIPVTRVIQIDNAVAGDYYEVYLSEVGGTGSLLIDVGTRLGFAKLTGEKGEKGDTGAAGADGDMTWEGTWVSQNYTANQAVYYAPTGQSYVCKLNTVSNEDPTNTTYWDILAQKGDTGTAPFIDTIMCYTQNNTRIEEGTTSYVSKMRYIYRGTANVPTIKSIKVLGNKTDSATSWEIRIYDLTNALVIAEGSFTSATPTIQDLGTISNLPTGMAQFQIQMKRTGGNGAVHLYSVSLEY